jgi:eukaryotic-like serine/threonine-protein kinase
MAEVFLAHDVTEDRDVAVKVVRSSDPALAQRLALEAQALARLVHPGLVRLLDAGVHGGQAYLVMELVEGPTLAARLQRGPLSPARTAILGRTIADALAFVHGRGIVHRDVKPANVLLGPGQRARLADFGIARLADASSLTITGTTLGTAAYMAPEQIEHHAVGPAADAWSLGVILLECLTGRRVFEGSATEVMARRLAGPVPLPPDLPTPWRILFEGMLSTEPGRRPSASHVAGILAAEPFSEPWDRAAEETVAAPVGAPAGAGAPGSPDPGGNGVPANPGAVATRGGDPVNDDRRGDTLVAPSALRAPEHRQPKRSRRLSPWLWLVAVVVLAAAGIAAWQLDPHSTPHASNQTRSSTTTVPPTTTSTTTTTSVPTTTTPTTSSAAATLLNDIESGVNDGSVSASAGRSLRGDLDQALTASSDGDQNQVSQSVDAMDSTIDNQVQNGSMSPSESSKLFVDVGNLANALGVSSTSTTSGGSGPTTTGNSGSGNSSSGSSSGNPSGSGNSGAGPDGGGPGGAGHRGGG